MCDNIVFYCKKCNGLMFAASRKPHVLKSCKKEIYELLQADYKMADLTTEEVKNSKWCSCNQSKKSNQEELSLGK